MASFVQMVDNSVLAEVEVAAWCPRMDLLALATTDGQLAVHRLTPWQRLWVATPDLPVTALTWCPDGKVLAGGQADGTLVLYDVEDGEALQSRQVHMDPISTAEWLEVVPCTNADGFAEYQDRTSRFLPPSTGGSIGNTAGVVLGGAGMGVHGGQSFMGNANVGTSQSSRDPKEMLSAASHWAAQGCAFNVLYTADVRGSVAMVIFGMYPLAWINVVQTGAGLAPPTPVRPFASPSLPQPPAAASSTPSSSKFSARAKPRARAPAGAVAMSPTLDGERLAVLVASPSAARAEENAQGGGGTPTPPQLPVLCLKVLTSSLVAERRRELRYLATQASHVMSHLGHVRKSLAGAAKQWGEAMAGVAEKLDKMGEVLRDHGAGGSPQEELLVLLATGSATAGLRHFLCSTLCESGVRRMAKAVDAAGAALHSALADGCLPAAELVVFRLGELQGLARWHPGAAEVGAAPGALTGAQDGAERALLLLTKLLRVVADTAAQYRTFFMWLIQTLRKLDKDEDQPPPSSSAPTPEADVLGVAQFLTHQLVNDCVAPHLAPATAAELDPEGYSGLEATTPGPRSPGQSQCGAESSTLQTVLANADPNSQHPADSWRLRAEVDKLHACCKAVFRQTQAMVSPTLEVISIVPLVEGGIKKLHADFLTSESDLSTQFMTFHVCERDIDEGKAAVITSKNNVEKYIGVVRLTHSKDKAVLSEGCLIELPSAELLVDLSFYKEAQLALLLQKAGINESGEGDARLLLVNCAELPFVSVETTQDAVPLLRQCLVAGAVVGMEEWLAKTEVRERTLPVKLALAPLSVSGSRSLGCVLGNNRRLLLYDLAEDEDNSESGGDEEEDGDDENDEDAVDEDGAD